MATKKKKVLPDGRTITEQDFANYCDWTKRILACQVPYARGEPRKASLLAFSFALASYGTVGLYCYASDETLADDLQCRRDDAGRYRTKVLDLGWFTVVKRIGRSTVLDIAVPDCPLTGAIEPRANALIRSGECPHTGTLPSNPPTGGYYQELNNDPWGTAPSEPTPPPDQSTEPPMTGCTFTDGICNKIRCPVHYSLPTVDQPTPVCICGDRPASNPWCPVCFP
jgi:hypothetical protein